MVDDVSRTKQCGRCLRVGTRGFQLLKHPMAEREQWWICVSINACEKRKYRRFEG